jgi:hypothetical protein
LDESQKHYGQVKEDRQKIYYMVLFRLEKREKLTWISRQLVDTCNWAYREDD